MSFNDRLHHWYASNHRNLPWRETSDLYRIWLSEIMLQQTRVATVLPYYEKWLNELPTMESVADAPQERLYSLWQGLGYYSRCRNFQKGIQFVLENGVPETAKAWLRVPGVGPYTASAIASICFGEAVPSVDGNVLRVVSRLKRIEHGGSKLEETVREFCFATICTKSPSAWNQAMMELGATICLPKSPKCHLCPVSKFCEGREIAHSLPIRKAKPEVHRLEWSVVVHTDGKSFGVEESHNEKWWKGMWVLPRAEASALPGDFEVGKVTGTVTNHVLSIAVLIRQGTIADGLKKIRWSYLDNAPLPAPYRQAINLARTALETISTEADQLSALR